jgi:hypothetical protein
VGNSGLALEPGVLAACYCGVGAFIGAPAVGNSGLALEPGALGELLLWGRGIHRSPGGGKPWIRARLRRPGGLAMGQRGGARLTLADRLILVWLYRLRPSVLSAVVIVRPETVVRWHREGQAVAQLSRDRPTDRRDDNHS